MARPTKSEPDRREVRLNLRLTFAERAEIERDAGAVGLSPTEFTRRRSLGLRLPPRSEDQQAQSLMAAALIGLGNNLNQLVHRAHVGREAPPDVLLALLGRINAALDGIYDHGADGRRA